VTRVNSACKVVSNLKKIEQQRLEIKDLELDDWGLLQLCYCFQFFNLLLVIFKLGGVMGVQCINPKTAMLPPCCRSGRNDALQTSRDFPLVFAV